MEAKIVWKIVMRRGMNVTFACGHRHGRSAAYVCLSADRRELFVRRVPRPQAERHPCHDCLLGDLQGRASAQAEGYERLERLEDALVDTRKDRPS